MILGLDLGSIGDQFAAAIGAAVVLAAFGYLVRHARRNARNLDQLSQHVLPHFAPPSAEEQRDGVEDRTIPARMARMETRLSRHLDEETAAAKLLDQRLADGGERIERIEAAVEHLAGANPEYRGPTS